MAPGTGCLGTTGARTAIAMKEPIKARSRNVGKMSRSTMGASITRCDRAYVESIARCLSAPAHIGNWDTSTRPATENASLSNRLGRRANHASAALSEKSSNAGGLRTQSSGVVSRDRLR
jgi:hypothetical protein